MDSGGKVGSAAGDPAETEEEELVEEPLVDADFDLVRSRGANVHAVPSPAGELLNQYRIFQICVETQAGVLVSVAFVPVRRVSGQFANTRVLGCSAPASVFIIRILCLLGFV